jgi:flagellar biosynthesis protein FlhF
MNLRTYQAATMAQALAQVKHDLGRDAVILHTRNFRKGWLLGWLTGKSMWEVTASPSVNVPPRASEGKYQPAAAKEWDAGKKTRATGLAGPEGSVGNEMGQIRRMVQSLLLLHSGHDGANLPPAMEDLRQQLVSQEVNDDLVAGLFKELTANMTGEQLADAPAVRARLVELMAAMVMTVSGTESTVETGRPRTAMFIGPTGVGKTTTIAKLAANFKIRQHQRVGMITIDTYRIAAVDQLKTYAEIIDVPLQVVLTAGELRQALHAMRNCDRVLIDTAGRSQQDRLRLSQLCSFLKAAEPQEVHLVMPATASRNTVVSVIERFVPMGVNRIIMTKLDEATSLGTVLNVAAVSRLPVSYVTTGQDVPDDIYPADPAKLAQCILEGTSYVAQ